MLEAGDFASEFNAGSGQRSLRELSSMPAKHSYPTMEPLAYLLQMIHNRDMASAGLPTGLRVGPGDDRTSSSSRSSNNLPCRGRLLRVKNGQELLFQPRALSRGRRVLNGTASGLSDPRRPATTPRPSIKPSTARVVTASPRFGRARTGDGPRGCRLLRALGPGGEDVRPHRRAGRAPDLSNGKTFRRRRL